MRKILFVLHKSDEDKNRGDKTKYILPKFFYYHELQENRQVNVKQIRSTNNLANLFTKSLPISTFEKLVYGIGMR